MSSSLYLNNRYRIIGGISTGETSEVSKAEDKLCDGQIVIIKRFLPLKTNRGHGAAGYQQELEFLARLNHPGIPKLYDHFFSAEGWYIVQSFIEGETLTQRWNRARKETCLTPQQTLDIGIQICQILQYLHNLPRPIIFRDLNPSNIILAPCGGLDEEQFHIYLIDFEGACYVDTARDASIEIIATRGYTAPEVLHRRASLQSDIYSLGATLFQLVTGQKPTSRTSHDTRFNADYNFEQQGLDELWELIKRMMEDDASERPESIIDVEKDLLKISKQIVDKVKEVEATSQKPMNRRNFLFTGAVGVSGLLLGGCVVGAFLHSHSHIFTTIKVGSKLDNEALLLGEMYFLLLQNASYQVIDLTLTGQSVGTFNSLINGDIDVYPEYSQSGLAQLNMHSKSNDQLLDWLTVNNLYQQKYKVTWLTMDTQLNDNYCVAMPSKVAQRANLKTLVDLTVYNKNHDLSVAVAPDGMDAVIPLLKNSYGLVFAHPYEDSEPQSFEDVLEENASLNICYATDPLLKKYEFLKLQDNKGALPADSPSPIVRIDVLKKAPDIDGILRVLASVLTTDDSIALQGELPSVSTSKETRQGVTRKVAQDWLHSKGLI